MKWLQESEEGQLRKKCFLWWVTWKCRTMAGIMSWSKGQQNIGWSLLKNFWTVRSCQLRLLKMGWAMETEQETDFRKPQLLNYCPYYGIILPILLMKCWTVIFRDDNFHIVSHLSVELCLRKIYGMGSGSDNWIPLKNALKQFKKSTLANRNCTVHLPSSLISFRGTSINIKVLLTDTTLAKIWLNNNLCVLSFSNFSESMNRCFWHFWCHFLDLKGKLSQVLIMVVICFPWTGFCRVTLI